jgi:hypothetical protein
VGDRLGNRDPLFDNCDGVLNTNRGLLVTRTAGSGSVKNFSHIFNKTRGISKHAGFGSINHPKNRKKPKKTGEN